MTTVSLVNILVLGISAKHMERTCLQLQECGLVPDLTIADNLDDLDRLVGSRTWHGILVSPTSPHFGVLRIIRSLEAGGHQIPILVLIDADEERVLYAHLGATVGGPIPLPLARRIVGTSVGDTPSFTNPLKAVAREIETCFPHG